MSREVGKQRALSAINYLPDCSCSVINRIQITYDSHRLTLDGPIMGAHDRWHFLFFFVYYYVTNGAEESAELHSHYVRVTWINNDRVRHIRQRIVSKCQERCQVIPLWWCSVLPHQRPLSINPYLVAVSIWRFRHGKDVWELTTIVSFASAYFGAMINILACIHVK